MTHFAPKQHRTIFVGYEKGDTLYIREGLFSDKKLISPDYEEYDKVQNLLGDKLDRMFTAVDVEYNYLKGIYDKGKE